MFKKDKEFELPIGEYYAKEPNVNVRKVITDLILSAPLYHEIGHHIDRKSGKNDEDREKDAERWRKKFQKHYMIRYHFLFFFLAFVTLFPFRKRLMKICSAKLQS